MNILTLLLATAVLAHMDIKKVGNFDYFELTLIYPTSVCRAYNAPTRFVAEETTNFCKVPVNTFSWTIHGLWPDRNDGSFPQFCVDKTKRFVLSKLLPIQQELERKWPNLLVLQSVSSLWKHEWEKHGTCAGTVEEVDDELKYFNRSLALYEQFNIFGTLEKQGIIPSEKKLYDWLLLHQSLRSAYGKHVEFHCLQDKETKSWLLADVRLCLTKNFQLMDCKKRPWKWQSSKKSLLTYQPCPADDALQMKTFLSSVPSQ
uniref:Ribonuclease T(2) n=1 Tax=Loa loa TaxID=7209 RepID=A0A1I7VSL4_LOALO